MRVIIPLSAVTGLVAAHFQLEQPVWRADSLAENTTYDQWEYPCAGVPYGTGNKTEWPIGGGSVALDLHHPWSYLYINLGLGENTTNFNISLTPELLNVTGSGNFCIPALPVPIDVADGQSATLQVVTNGQSGSALYNCADIVFRSSAKPLSGESCANSTGVTASVVGTATTTEPGSSPTETPSSAPAGILGDAFRAAVFGVAITFGLLVAM